MLTASLDKRKREEEKAKRDANDRDISQFFMKGQAAGQTKAKVGRLTSIGIEPPPTACANEYASGY